MNNYKKIFLDTCVLSDIGRMEKEKRNKLAYEFLVNKKYQIILPTYILDELEKLPDNEVRKNVYEFLEVSYVGFPKGADKIFAEEIKASKENDNIEIVEFNVSMLQKDCNGEPMDFKNFINKLFSNYTFKIITKQNEIIKKHLQFKKRPLKDINNYFDLIIFNHIYENKLLNINYNVFPGFTIWAYSLAHKIGSRGIRKKYNEVNDVAMSYIVPYVDIVIAEKKQINLYKQLKERKMLYKLNEVVLKKHSEVFVNGEFMIEKTEE